jgi:hypothetical protein
MELQRKEQHILFKIPGKTGPARKGRESRLVKHRLGDI